MKKDIPFPGFAEPRQAGGDQTPDPPLRVARSPEGLYAVLPGAQDAPEPKVLPVFEDRDMTIHLARICLALGVYELGPFQE